MHPPSQCCGVAGTDTHGFEMNKQSVGRVVPEIGGGTIGETDIRECSLVTQTGMSAPRKIEALWPTIYGVLSASRTTGSK